MPTDPCSGSMLGQSEYVYLVRKFDGRLDRELINPYGKGGKTRMVFIGRKTRRAIRAYLRLRHDSSPALFISKDEEHLTYDGLRLLLERRAKRATLSNKPKLHGFRRAFALNMLRSDVDIFV